MLGSFKQKNKSRVTIITKLPLSFSAKKNIEFLRKINWSEEAIAKVIKYSTEVSVFSTTKSRSGNGDKYASYI